MVEPGQGLGRKGKGGSKREGEAANTNETLFSLPNYTLAVEQHRHTVTVTPQVSAKISSAEIGQIHDHAS
jgi:hypothetical protein